MEIVYVGGHDEVEIDGYGLAQQGVPVDVPDELAGRAPSGGRWDVDDQGVSLYDAGEGLLAQPTNWQPAAPVKLTRAQKAAADKAAADAAEQQAAAEAAAAANSNGGTV
jgi:hypothetical protein